VKTYCVGCQKEHHDFNWKLNNEGWRCRKYFKPSNPEFVPDRIKDERKKYLKSTFQPYRDGTLSKEYVEANPDKAKKQFTPQQISKAKNTWSDLPNYQNWRKTL
jgi:hypothetical protein